MDDAVDDAKLAGITNVSALDSFAVGHSVSHRWDSAGTIFDIRSAVVDAGELYFVLTILDNEYET